MTTTSPTQRATYVPPAEVPATPARGNHTIDVTAREWRAWAIVSGAVLGLYLLLLNPFWVPGGDSELYLAVARSWAQGGGHVFNGQPVSICPPGWPLLLAGAMKISPSFLLLKSITLLCMAGAMSIWYWILLRFTTPLLSALVVLAGAILQQAYTLSFWMHSDALFCLLSAGAMLVACQINEGRSRLRVRIGLLILLCVLATFVRWAGVLQFVLVAGLLLRGWRLPFARGVAHHAHPAPAHHLAIWCAIVLSGVATLATFFVVRHALALTPQQLVLAKDAGATFEESQPPPSSDSRTLDLITAKSTAQKSVAHQYWDRIRNSPKWFSWLLWPMMRFFASGGRVINWIDSAFGWPVIILLAMAVVQGVWRRQWIWPAMGIYCGALCLNWPNPNARYLVPVAPLLIWGVVRGIEMIGRGGAWTKFHRRALATFIASILICNAILYGIDVYVARSGDFYGRYEGGLDRSLIDAAAYLNSMNLSPRRIAVSEEYINLNKRRASKFGLRATVMLTDLEVVNTPLAFSDDPSSPRFLRWSNQRKVVQWYLFQQEASPWRVWHFRIPAWLQEKLTHNPVPPPSEGWVLYRRAGAQWLRVDVPHVKDWPRRVPGME